MQFLMFWQHDKDGGQGSQYGPQPIARMLTYACYVIGDLIYPSLHLDIIHPEVDLLWLVIGD